MENVHFKQHFLRQVGNQKVTFFSTWFLQGLSYLMYSSIWKILSLLLTCPCFSVS